MSIRGRCFVTIVASWLSVASLSAEAWADGADAGGYLGAAVPLGTYEKTADTGGVIGGWGGYRWDFDDVGLSVIGNPQWTLLPPDECPRGPTLHPCSNDDDVASTFSFTAGPKLSLRLSDALASLAVLGGYFGDISGPLDENGGGLAVHATVAGYVGAGIHLGVFARFENAWLAPAANSRSGDRQMVMTGLSIGWSQYRSELEPAPVAPVAAAAPASPPVGRKFILRGVNFDFDKASIRPDATPVLDEAVRTLRDQPDIDVRVEGYTDAIGSDAYNQRLSERRAKAVMNYLVSRGIAPSRLQAVGYGESNPVASNETAEGRAQNRRAELVVVE